jgi:hypothetical protein
MAQHIDTVASSSIPKVSQAEFMSAARPGDLVFCSGADGISIPIEKETGSPFSHVLQLWPPEDCDLWLTLESTIEHGVHVGKWNEYFPGYNGDMVLCRRPSLSAQDIISIRDRFLTILDDGYNWKTEVGIAAHNLLKFLPVDNPKAEYYCSGAQYVASLAVAPGLQRPSELWLPTPEDNFTDPSVEAVCAILKGSA